MAQSPQSLIIVGGGIVGLTLAVLARHRGHAVTVLAADSAGATASGVAAGMIAPALEAINDPEPDRSYARLHAAQAAWFDQFDAWPDDVRRALLRSQDRAVSRYVWPQSDNTSDHVTPRLAAMGVPFQALLPEDLHGVAADCNGVRVEGELLVEGQALLQALEAAVPDQRRGRVTTVTATTVTLSDGETLSADAVVLAAGFGAHALADHVPCLAHLTPVKGHILDLSGQGDFGVTRSPYGYLADYGVSAKFGATMQFGQADTVIEPAVVEQLRFQAQEILPGLDTSHAVPRAAVRAASPDGWPMIGRDAASGVWVATAMRRNGYVFAPFAARLVLDLVAGLQPDGAELYDPNRF